MTFINSQSVSTTFAKGIYHKQVSTDDHRPTLATCLEWKNLTQFPIDVNMYLAQCLNFLF